MRLHHKGIPQNHVTFSQHFGQQTLMVSSDPIYLCNYVSFIYRDHKVNRFTCINAKIQQKDVFDVFRLKYSIFRLKYSKKGQKMAQNGHFSKFWNFDFSMKVQDMKIGVGLDENTSLGHVLKWLRHIHHSNCKYPPAIFQSHENRRFLPLILAEIRKSTLWSTLVDQNFCRKL